ncbi:MAG: cytochrome c family protein [Alphaproteobacteria bacterium]|nr:cytochrome c family protein [Alphaproteobacteria bacterium SS10]
MGSLENNKIFGALIMAGLVAMMASFISRKIVHPEAPHETALEISGVETAVVASGPTGPEPILAMLATADVDAGAGVARACAACHSFDEGGPNRVGPNLYNVVNASKAHLDNYSYSSALAAFEGEWTYEALNKFFYRPKDYVPGTKMNYVGLKDPEDRANLIAYMRSLSGSPVALPDEARIQAEIVDLGYDVAEAAEENLGDATAEAIEDAAQDAVDAVSDGVDTVIDAVGDAIDDVTSDDQSQ